MAFPWESVVLKLLMSQGQVEEDDVKAFFKRPQKASDPSQTAEAALRCATSDSL